MTLFPFPFSLLAQNLFPFAWESYFHTHLCCTVTAGVVCRTLTGSACSQLLGDVWYALDAVWRTAQIVHLIAAAFDATWQVIITIIITYSGDASARLIYSQSLRPC